MYFGQVLVAQSCPALCSPMDYSPPGSPAMEFSKQEYWSGLPFPLQGIAPTQGLNPGLLHCRWILNQLSHKENPRILEWVAYSFSSGSSQPRNRTRVSCIASRFFTNWAIREADKSLGEVLSSWSSPGHLGSSATEVVIWLPELVATDFRLASATGCCTFWVRVWALSGYISSLSA